MREQRLTTDSKTTSQLNHTYDPNKNSRLAQFAGVVPAAYYQARGTQLVNPPTEYITNRQYFANQLNALSEQGIVQNSAEARLCLGLLRGQNDAQQHQRQDLSIETVFKFLEQIEAHALLDEALKSNTPENEIYLAHRELDIIYHHELEALFIKSAQYAGADLHRVGCVTEAQRQRMVAEQTLEEKLIAHVDHVAPFVKTINLSPKTEKAIETAKTEAGITDKVRKSAAGFDESQVTNIPFETREREPATLSDILAESEGQRVYGIDYAVQHAPKTAKHTSTMSAIWNLFKAALPQRQQSTATRETKEPLENTRESETGSNDSSFNDSSFNDSSFTDSSETRRESETQGQQSTASDMDSLLSHYGEYGSGIASNACLFSSSTQNETENSAPSQSGSETPDQGSTTNEDPTVDTNPTTSADYQGSF